MPRSLTEYLLSLVRSLVFINLYGGGLFLSQDPILGQFDRYGATHYLGCIPFWGELFLLGLMYAHNKLMFENIEILPLVVELKRFNFKMGDK